MNFTTKTTAIILAIASSHGIAHAQTVSPQQDVANRSHPGYEPIPLPLMGFNILPTLAATANASDNYQASNINRQSDLYFDLRPDIGFKSNWRRHQVDGHLYFDQSKHATRPTEDSSTYGASINGNYDFSQQTQFHARAAYAREAEARGNLGSFQGSLKPVLRDNVTAGLGLSHNINDLTLTGDVDFTMLKFKDAELPGGIFKSQTDRNYRDLGFSGSAQYDLGNGIGLIATGKYNKTIYDVRPGQANFILGSIDRGSHGITAQGGLNLELSRLIFGKIQVGYLDRKYNDPLLRGFKGLSFDANLLWNVTPLTSLVLSASRSVDETASVQVSSNTRTDFTFAAHHELYRNVLITAQADYSHFQPNGGVGFGATQVSGQLGVRYLLDRHFSINGQLRHSKRTSSFALFEYSQSSGFASVTYAF